MTNDQIKMNLVRSDLAKRELARRHFTEYMLYMHPGQISVDTHFHKNYYKVLDMFAHGIIRKLIVVVSPQHGKALKYDEKILTVNRGWVNHSELQPNVDKVYDPKGNPVKVLWNSGVYEWTYRKVTFNHNVSIIASYNHEWGVYAKDTFYPRIETDKIPISNKPFFKAYNQFTHCD